MGVALFGALMLTTPFAPRSLWSALAGPGVMHGTILWLMLRRWPVLDPEHPPRPLGASPAADRLSDRP